MKIMSHSCPELPFWEGVKLLAPVKSFIPKKCLFFNITIRKLSKNFQEPKTLLPPFWKQMKRYWSKKRRVI